jgi:Restriction endonuclease
MSIQSPSCAFDANVEGFPKFDPIESFREANPWIKPIPRDLSPALVDDSIRVARRKELQTFASRFQIFLLLAFSVTFAPVLAAGYWLTRSGSVPIEWYLYATISVILFLYTARTHATDFASHSREMRRLANYEDCLRNWRGELKRRTQLSFWQELEKDEKRAAKRGHKFAQEVACLMHASRGWTVHIGPGSGDWGADLLVGDLLRPEIVIQCKHLRKRTNLEPKKPGAAVVRELFGTAEFFCAPNAMLVALDIPTSAPRYGNVAYVMSKQGLRNFSFWGVGHLIHEARAAYAALGGTPTKLDPNAKRFFNDDLPTEWPTVNAIDDEQDGGEEDFDDVDDDEV